MQGPDRRPPSSHPRGRWFWQVLLANIFCSEAYHQNLFTLSQLDKREWVLGLGGGGTLHLLGSRWSGGSSRRGRRAPWGDVQTPGSCPPFSEPRGASPRGTGGFRAPPQGELTLEQRL